jgi:predicted Zn-dependent peptidase
MTDNQVDKAAELAKKYFGEWKTTYKTRAIVQSGKFNARTKRRTCQTNNT